jgi:hypothetical protein
MSKKFLNDNDSIFAAVYDFQDFTMTCFETCSHKQANVDNKDKESI